MRIAVLEHEPEAPAALYADWARERGHELDVLAVPALARWPQPGEHDAVVSLGSDRSVHASAEPWIAPELRFLRSAHEHGVPLLGICFGGQALARALGGQVTRSAATCVSWLDVSTSAPELIPPGPWLRWHEDVFTLPPGARELARDDGGPPLAFALGTSVGLQFHPEADTRVLETWIAGDRERLLAQGIDEARVRREAARAEPGARDRAFDLFDRVARRWRDGGS
jgi:GMP synthase-like glutamine amidotransferase